jgi:hypothetical protein
MSDTVLADFKLPRPLRKTLGALARVVCTDEVETLGLTDAVVDGVELHMRSIPALFRAGLVAGLASFEAGAAAWPRALGRPFSRLPADLQEAYFRSWWASPLFPMRQLAKGVKGLLAMSYWEQPEVKRRLEYHPERWIAEVAARRLRDHADDARAHDELVRRPDPLVPAASLTRGGKKKVDHAA